MTNKRIAFAKLAIAAAAVLFGAFFLFRPAAGPEAVSASASGPSPSFTNAPGENSCTACHTSFPLNSGKGRVSISGLPANYGAGRQILVTVTVSDPQAVIYGFQLTAIDSAGRSAGLLIPGDNPQLQTVAGMVEGNQRSYIEHTEQGTVPTQFGSKSWSFIWNSPTQRIGKIRFFAAGNAANSDMTSSGDHIYASSTATLSGTAIANFDNDTRSDISVYRPSNGTWYTQSASGYRVVQFGEAGDVFAPGDHDGDGTTDHAAFRPSTGTWHIRLSSGGTRQQQFGQNGDVPVPGDYDGDTISDLAVWRPSNSTWYVLGSTGTYSFRPFGNSTDKPVQADYDGDGRTDIAVFRPSNGTWYIIRSAAEAYTVQAFGQDGDLPAPGDYDGDGKWDIAVFRPSNGTWYTITATNGYYFRQFGAAGDEPVPADYDGDGKTDLAVFRSGTWFILGTEGPTYSVTPFGQAGDLPVPGGYLPD